MELLFIREFVPGARPFHGNPQLEINSTHMLVFQRDLVQLADWAVHAVQHQNDKNPTPMGSVVAWAKKK